MFADDELRLDDQFGDDRFNSKNWTGLGASEKQVFWDYVMPVEFLTFDANDPREVNHAFDRLNRNMRKLEPQELRHARWDGWFIKFIDSQCEDLVWKQVGVVNSTRSKRMKDAQFLSELFLVVIDKKSNGFDQQRLDDAYGKYDEIDDAEFEADSVIDSFNQAKLYIDSMNFDGVVKTYASTLAAFYTLWCAVVLHRSELCPPEKFASVFQRFRQLVDELKSAENPSEFLVGEHADDYRIASKFLDAFGGASTDLTPRNDRLDALLAFVRKYASENT